VTTPLVVTSSAPGKLVLIGEYAVLRGHDAVVAAVDVRAHARRAGGEGLHVERDAGGLLDACLHEAVAIGAPPRGRLTVDTSAFHDTAGRKFGLGSSAAACVATMHALLAPDGGGVDVTDRVHAAAQRAHRRFQRGRGSGIDVAASTFGGLVRFARRGEVCDAARAPSLPADLVVVAVWTGQSQDTRDFVGGVLALPDVDDAVTPLAEAATRFLDACARQDAVEVLGAVADAATGMQRLGARAGIDVVSPPHLRLVDVARAHGGAAKPSGAGGGDVGLAFVRRGDETALRAALVTAGLAPLSLRVGVDVDGVRRDPSITGEVPGGCP
jgi:phosphomevalonate kinase